LTIVYRIITHVVQFIALYLGVGKNPPTCPDLLPPPCKEKKKKKKKKKKKP
jgi:hypothetical protein